MTSSPHIRKALELLKVSSQLEHIPGFGSAFGSVLGVSWKHLQAEQFAYQGKTLKIRMPLTKSLLWKDDDDSAKKSGVGLLSTFAALVDETTTLALVVGDPKRGRPGVSVLLAMEAGPALHTLSAGDEIEISSLVQRAGRNLGFTKAEIRVVPTGQLICTASHIKFLNNLPFVANFLVSSYGWPLLKGYCDYMLKEPTKEAPPTKHLVQLFSSLESDGSKATFTASRDLSSGGGPIHGGAQAIILERAAESTLPTNDFVLDSMKVEYLSTPNVHPEVKIVCNPTGDDNKVVICAELWSRGKLNSTGLFQYSKRSFPSSRI